MLIEDPSDSIYLHRVTIGNYARCEKYSILFALLINTYRSLLNYFRLLRDYQSHFKRYSTDILIQAYEKKCEKKL